MNSIDVNDVLIQIQGAIYDRLSAWAKGADFDEDIMLHSQKVVKNFLNSERHAPGRGSVEGNFYTGARGWHCGLGQMLDLDKEIVCKTLPYILTAYMYNYNLPKKDFVRRFAAKNEASIDEDVFFGIKPHQISEEKMPGIEKLLARKYVIEGSSDYETLRRLAKLFVFSDVAVYSSTTITDRKYISVIGDFDRQYVFPKGYGKGKNMDAAEQRATSTYTHSSLPPIGEDGFIYGRSRSCNSIEHGLDQLHHDLIDFCEKMEAAEGEEKNRLRAYFLHLSHTFSTIQDAFDELEVEIDEMEKALNDVEKAYKLKREKYNRRERPPAEELLGFSGGMSYDTILNIFATWYHLWKKSEDISSSGWPGYKVDPILCVILLKETLPLDGAASDTSFRDALDELGEEKARCFVDSLIEAHYNAIGKSEDGVITMSVPPHWTLREFMHIFPSSKHPYSKYPLPQ